MKKSLFTACALLAGMTQVAHAQLHVTPEVGANISIYNGGQLTPTSIPNSTASYQFGASTRFMFNKQDTGLGLESGLFFVQRKDPLSFFLSPASEGNIETTFTTDKRYYLELPIMVQYAWKFNANTRFSLSAGGYIGFLVGSDSKAEKITYIFEDNNYGYNMAIFDQNSSSRTLEGGFTGKIGFEYHRVAFSLRYSIDAYRGMRNIDGGSNTKEHRLFFGVGYTF